DHLLFTPAERMTRALAQVCDAKAIQHCVDAPGDLAPGHADVAQSEGNVVGDDRKHDLVVRVLKHEAHFLPDGTGVARSVQARNLHTTRYGQNQPVKQTHQCAFARSVCAHDADALFGQAQRDPAQDRTLLQDDTDVVELD